MTAGLTFTFAQIEALAMKLSMVPATRSVVRGVVSALGVANIRSLKDTPALWPAAMAILAKGSV